MKKFFGLWIIVLCCIFVSNIIFWDTYCSPYLNDYDRCVNFENWLDKALNAENRQDYVEMIYDLEQCRKYAVNENVNTINGFISDYSNLLWNIYFNKGNFSYAIKYYKKALAIYQNAVTLYNIWRAYFYIEDYDTALTYLNKAKQKSLDASLDENLTYRITLTKLAQEYSKLKKTWETNDRDWYFQYYMQWINIFNARDKLPNNTKKVVIAVIDDWVNLNHPDLKDKIRTNKKEIDGDLIDNDKNWYIDDYNWWDFTLNTKPTLPSDSHGTMVAGIIAANTNNVIWIAWIVPNVEIMSLKVFWLDSNWANEDDIIEAINYAIENGADIINLSLGKHQFTYDNKFNPILKKAYDKWIIVVIAAWNGDLLSLYNDWINTSVNQISPVCNEVNKKAIIWVWALTKKWAQAKWSNYGSCVDFYMYWEEIYSTSISLYSNYDYKFEDWTSFSAPIIAWIIWLWFNKFWWIKPDIVYDNLKKSLSWNVIDAAKYLDNLSVSIWELKSAISWLSSKWFTKAKNVDEFKYSNWITRAEAAKFFVMYAEKFNKNKIVNSDDKCNFSDLANAPADLRSYVINACRYWLLAWSKWKFMANSKLTNAQAVTVFMRMYGWKKDETWNHYADKYFIDAYKLWLIDWMIMWKQKNYEKGATRWDIAILLYRWTKLMSNQK